MSDDALTARQAREHIGDIASALRTINGRAEELAEAIEERDETIARLTAAVREHFAAEAAFDEAERAINNCGPEDAYEARCMIVAARRRARDADAVLRKIVDAAR